jgi:uncharacterized protein with beta-barrel porin domain
MPVLSPDRPAARARTALLSVVAVAFLSWQSAPALAACSTTTPADGDTVTCTGTETNMIGTGAENQVTVNVQSGASIAVGADAIGILLRNQNRVTNSGSISAGDATGGGFGYSGGIFFTGDGNVAVNNGAIAVGNATGGQVFGIQSYGIDASITNNNTITVGNGSGSIPYPTDASGIAVINSSQVINNGSIITGNFSQGIFACCSNQITNNAGALIQAGDNSFGIFAGGDANTISNAGQIVVGNGTNSGFGFVYSSYGILLSGSNNTVTNTGTIRVGDLSVGMAIDDPLSGGGPYSGNTLINGVGGTIRAGNGSFGISSGSQFAFPPDATLTNNGTIIVGNAVSGVSPAVGILAYGPATITNGGSITVGDGDFGTPALGIYAIEAASTVVNSGSIFAGLSGIGIRAAGDGTTVNNAGPISVGAGGVGIDVTFPYTGTDITGPAITNFGTIIAGAGGTGVNFGDSGSLTNNGLIRAAGDGLGNGYSVFTCSCTTTTITNAGTLDGKVQAEGVSTTFVNSGLITITDSNAVQPIAPFNFNISDFSHGGGGSFQQTAEGTLSLRVMPGAPAPIDSLLGDTVTLAGTLRASIQSGLYANTTITDAAVSLTGNGAAVITTTFDHFVSSSPFFTVTPIYNTGDPSSYNFLSLQLDRIPFGSVPGATPNEQAVGNALEAAYSPSLDPGSVPGQFFANLFNITSVSVLDQLSGAGTAAAQDASFSAASLFGGTMLQQGLAWLDGTFAGAGIAVGGPLGYSAPSAGKLADKPGYDAFAAIHRPDAPIGRWRAWGLGFGATRTTDGQASAGTANQSTNAFGGSFGADHEIAADFLAGFAVGGSRSQFSADSLSTSGHTDAALLGVYAIHRFGAAYLAATMNYARTDTSTGRTITGVGATENATGRFAGDQLGGRLELGWKHAMHGYSVTPFVAIEPATLWQHAYTESSTTVGGAPGVLGLSYQANTITSFPMFVGAQFDARYQFSGGQVLTPYLRASWVHEFKPDRSITASFTSIPGTNFTAEGARAAAESARIDAGGALSLSRTTALFFNLNGEVSDRSQSIAGMGGARVTW